MSDSKDAILARIREALRVPTDPHVRRAGELPVLEAVQAGSASPWALRTNDHESHGPGAHATVDDADRFRRWLPAVGASYQIRKLLFAERSAALKTTLTCVPTLADAAESLQTLAAQNSWKRIALHDEDRVAQATARLITEKLSTDGGYDCHALEQCDAAVTACDALIAQTGSVLLTSKSAGGRALSVLPPHHVVVATHDQLLADLPAAFALLKSRYADDWPSFMTLITGPSRTGDIERILVLGAHGPKWLTILLVEEGSPAL